MFAITGAGLVLRPQMEGWINRDLLTVPRCGAPLPLDTLTNAARAAHPASTPHAIEISQDPTASTAIQFGDDDYVYLDPCTARVLGTQNQYAGLFGTMDWLHRFKFVGHGGGSGRAVAGYLNITFALLLILGGIVLWWPRRRGDFKKAITFQWRRAGSARTLSLHKVVGIYSALLLLLIVMTALPLSLQPFRDLISWATQSSVVRLPPPVVSRPSTGSAPATMEALWQQARQRVTNIESASLYYPSKNSALAHVEILERGMPHANAKSELYLNAQTAQPIRFDSYTTALPEGRKVYLYLLALHSGLVGGLSYQLLLFLAVLGIPVQFYSGASAYLRRRFRKPVRPALLLQLIRKTREAEGICSFEFADPEGRPLPPFSAGSHITVDTGCGIARQYSLCNDPAETHRYVIGVLLHSDSRGGSRAMHGNLKVGDLVQISTPDNHFPLVYPMTHAVLLAAGIGVTPILCMAERLANVGTDFSMHYCVHSLEHAAFLERINESPFVDRVTFHVSSAGTRLDISALLERCDHDTHFYVCGPGAFMQAVIATAKARGWPETQLHREYFSAAGNAPVAMAPFDIRIASTGMLIHVTRGETAVAALRRCGVEIPVSCAEGVCGTCLTKVLAGEIAHNDLFLTAEERARNDQFTPCCSRARSPLLILGL